MKKLVKFLYGAGAVACGVAVLASCGSKDESAKKVELTVWGPTEQTKVLEKLCKDFEAANETEKLDININVGVVSEADAFSTLQKDVASGADVYAFPNDQIANLIRIGGLSKIGGSILETIKAENGEGAVNAGKSGSNYYGFPYAADNGYFLYYDKSKLTEEDVKSLDGILAKCDATHQFLYDLDNSWYDAAFFFGAGCSYNVTYDDNAKETNITCDFDSDNGKKAGAAMVALANNVGFLNGGDDELKAGIGTNVIAGVSGTWNAQVIKEKLGDNYAACKLPTMTLDGKQVQMSSFAGYKLMGVNPATKNAEMAYKLAAYLTGEEAQAYRYSETETGPTNKNVAASEAVKANIALAALAEQGQYAVAQTAVPSNFWGAVENFGKEVVAKTVTTQNLNEKLAAVVTLIKTIGA